VGEGVLQRGQGRSCLARKALCERRLPLRELECFRLGTAMTTLTKRAEKRHLLVEDRPVYSLSGWIVNVPA